MSPRPSLSRCHPPQLRRAALCAGVALLAAITPAACTTARDAASEASPAARDSAAPTSAVGARNSLGVVGVAPQESGEGSGERSGAALVGRLVDEVVNDSGLQASWALYPTERHVGIVHVAIAGAHYLLADTLVGYDGPKARWRIRQVKRVATPSAGEAYVTSCAVAGSDAADGTIVARVTLTPGDTLPSPHAAWRFDPVAWRFHSFPTNALSCYNEGGGP